mmetsp:Transcript_30046/g.60002  ORF Transcript_30046/g.60002 Transcript_30046/m.60002 type:complete len:409 (-) Transcript_30046:71-1297(-)
MMKEALREHHSDHRTSLHPSRERVQRRGMDVGAVHLGQISLQIRRQGRFEGGKDVERFEDVAVHGIVLENRRNQHRREDGIFHRCLSGEHGPQSRSNGVGREFVGLAIRIRRGIFVRACGSGSGTPAVVLGVRISHRRRRCLVGIAIRVDCARRAPSSRPGIGFLSPSATRTAIPRRPGVAALFARDQRVQGGSDDEELLLLLLSPFRRRTAAARRIVAPRLGMTRVQHRRGGHANEGGIFHRSEELREEPQRRAGFGDGSVPFSAVFGIVGGGGRPPRGTMMPRTQDGVDDDLADDRFAEANVEDADGTREEVVDESPPVSQFREEGLGDVGVAGPGFFRRRRRLRRRRTPARRRMPFPSAVLFVQGERCHDQSDGATVTGLEIAADVRKEQALLDGEDGAGPLTGR